MPILVGGRLKNPPLLMTNDRIVLVVASQQLVQLHSISTARFVDKIKK
jgi:hypothetical protein